MSSHFTCACCGQTHEGLPTDWAFQLPDVVWKIPARERETAARFDTDLCEYGDRYFIRGMLCVPFRRTNDNFRKGSWFRGLLPTFFRKTADRFGWGAWAEVDVGVFKRYLELYDADGSAEPLHAGKLANDLPAYANSLDAPIQIQFLDKTQRPTFTLLAEDCSDLAFEQRNGIDDARYHQVLEMIESGRH